MAVPDDEQNAQPETSASTPNSTPAPHSASKTVHAPKDRACPFCGQAFTSSSLGRHLDLYIRPKNPKPPDGVHDVDEIRKLRGGITRRQPRTSGKAEGGAASNARNSVDHSATRRDGRGDGDEDEKAASTARADQETPIQSPVNSKDVQEPASFFNKANWQATGVINNLPPRAPSRSASEHPPAPSGQAQRIQDMRRDAGGTRIQRPEYEGGDSMWRLQEAAEMGRAAEMALREVLGSLEAAAKKVEPKLLYNDFDFFSLSFPGLCLAILPPPTTLFSPAPFASAESWTIGAPGLRQYEAMIRLMNERINQRQQNDPVPDSVLFKHHTHLSGAWEHWEGMPESERTSAWQLEILRSFTRSQERNEQLQTEIDRLHQHNQHLEAEYDRLSRCQLPREYLTHPPNTIPVPPAVMKEVNRSGASMSAAQANYNVETLISKWRSTIRANTRSSRTTAPSATSRPQIYTEKGSNALQEDMVMNGSVWGVQGPMPRASNMDWQQHEKEKMSYETPPNPGAVVGSADDEATPNNDADADGETEELDANDRANSMSKRRRLEGASAYGSPESSVLNGNVKRPLNGRGGGPRILKENTR
ncbi:hypothetical protein CB0940_01439 [Cercospora beticola]|uniref:Uncharacterized protein n=1 Tax=Cercospora beticola TaxID=122368 RepID=A0A2G5ICV0_CERBT|nr:hypothetical protein CB0940_01439 [Cercospora beticola]PIB02303.1 hypothetical protein CB0940_01439 [Cercospora beticola]WPA96877.1 hypothetical protein RHO25_001485 [Cercospora beticola]CAK1354748.1 unnamed protein product [Cercospora beticola]